MKTILIFGTFDFFHAGHLALIKQARKLGDRLVVVIARDETVERVKHQKPIHSEQDRKKIVSAIRYVDQVLLGSKTDVYAVLKKVKPDVIALGYDQTFFVDLMKEKIREFKLNTKIVRLKQYKTYKSSLIKLM